MESHYQLMSQFSDVTGVDNDRAQFYLESSGWQLEVAIASFFENEEPENDANNTREEVREDSEPPVRPTSMEVPKPISKPKSKGKPKSKSMFGTINDIQKTDSSSDEEEGQAFYAGGSEHSGQQVLGPSKKKDIVSDMFKSCQEHSIIAETSQRPNTFSGTGYKLGQTNSDTEVIAASGSGQQNETNITLKLWQNGFTINDGEFRDYTEQENREFLASIKRGEIPPAIRQEVMGAEVRLDMEDHRHEDYVPPKSKVKAFTGKGHMLGSPSPVTVGMTVPTDSADQAANEAQARQQLNVDESKPVTTIQIRLADGTVVKIQINLSHTVRDVRQFITTMKPQYAAREFNLLTTYPRKELDDNKTIEESGLQNSVIMQQLK